MLSPLMIHMSGSAAGEAKLGDGAARRRGRGAAGGPDGPAALASLAADFHANGFTKHSQGCF